MLQKLGDADVDEVLVGGYERSVLVAGDVDPGEDIFGTSGSRILREWRTRGELFAGSNPPHDLLLGWCQRVGPDGGDAPPVSQDSLGLAQVQRRRRPGERTPVLTLESLGILGRHPC